MGTITTNFANGLTTNGVLGASTINDNSISNITSIVGGGALKLISSQTASSSASLSFTTGIDSTYKTYMIQYNVHNAAGSHLFFNLSIDGGSNYNVAKTSNANRVYHNESDVTTLLDFLDGTQSLGNSTSNQYLIENQSSDADAIACGYLYLFNPSGTTYMKHFMADTQTMEGNPSSNRQITGGYAMTTSAINAIKFLPNSSTFTGTFHLYGLG